MYDLGASCLFPNGFVLSNPPLFGLTAESRGQWPDNVLLEERADEAEHVIGLGEAPEVALVGHHEQLNIG